MDPNTALLSILRGEELLDHVEALRGWLSRGGFSPDVELPDDALNHYKIILSNNPDKRVSANTAGLVVLQSRQWVPALDWNQVLEIGGIHGTTDDLEVIEDL
jgi:hypothetical protein